MESKLFSDKVFVVTGGAGGMGLAITTQLLEHGAYVYALDVQEGLSEGLAALSSPKLTYVQNDVRFREKCHEVVMMIIEKHNRLDGLVNNAAVCMLEGEMPGDDIYDKTFDINVRGVWNMGTEALVQMQKQGGGSIVNIGSTSCFRGESRLPIYSATKHAVAGLTRVWAIDFGKYGVRVNCVAPGPTDTNMARAPIQTVMGPRFEGKKTDDELLDLVAASLPLRKIGKPQDVANMVNFLMSELAGHVTGQIIAVSGGH